MRFVIALNALNKGKAQTAFCCYVKSMNFFEADETWKNPGFESAKPGKPETWVLK